MRAFIEKIEGGDNGKTVLTVTVQRTNYPGMPKESDYIQPWMKSPDQEAALCEAKERYVKAVSEWRLGEFVCTKHNNILDALRLGEIDIDQKPFVPREPRT
jgi:hypothetical protein